MSRKMTLSIVSVAALSFVLMTNDVQAGKVSPVRSQARVSQTAKKQGRVGKWWNSLKSVQRFKAGKAQRIAAREHGKVSDTAVKRVVRAVRTTVGLTIAGWDTAKHQKNAKYNIKKAKSEQGKYQMETLRGDGKMVEGVAALPVELAIEGVKAVRAAGLATLGAGLAAKDYTVQKTVAAKNYTVQKTVAAKDYTVQKTVAAKNYTVEKTVAAKRAVVTGSKNAYYRGEAAVAGAQGSVKGSAAKAAQKVLDGLQKDSKLQKRVAAREAAK